MLSTAKPRVLAPEGPLNEGGESFCLVSLAKKYSTQGFVVIPHEKIPFGPELLDLVNRLLEGPKLSVQERGDFERSTLISNGKGNTREGDLLLERIRTSGLSSFVSACTNWEVEPGDTTLVYYAIGNYLGEHSDSSARLPIVASLIRQAEYRGPSVLHIKDKATGRFVAPDLGGETWVLLDGTVPHYVSRVPEARRSIALGFRPVDAVRKEFLGEK